MNKIIKFVFFYMVIRPIVFLVLGLNIRNREKLPQNGPAIIVANHNSHLDTMVLLTLFPFHVLDRVRPIAAADYFLKTKLLAWFSTKIIGIIPLDRKRGSASSLDERLGGIYKALVNDQIVILFPEGSRGEPEQLKDFKAGVAIVAENFPDAPVIPIFMHGLGKALPKGEALLVPFFCDVFIGDEVRWSHDRQLFMSALQERMNDLASEGYLPDWN